MTEKFRFLIRRPGGRRVGRWGGFTLVELLVVVSLLALLLSILMPSLTQARARAKLLRCQTNIRGLGRANHLYAETYGVYVANYDFFNPPAVEGRRTGWGYWANSPSFLKLMGMTEKDFANLYKDEAGNPAGTTWPRRFMCPSWVKVWIVWDHEIPYGINQSYANKYGASGIPKFVVKQPSNKLMFADAQNWIISEPGADWKRWWDVYGEAFHPRGTEHGPCSTSTKYRHEEGVNITFWDGHVEYRRKQDAYFYNPPTSTTPDQVLNYQMWDYLH